MSRRVLSWQCLLLTVLAVLLQGTVGRKVISLYCPDFSQHPSILDALQAALPHVDMSELISAEAMGAIPQDMPEALQTFSRVVSNVLQQRLYLTSWVSDAQYTVHFNESIDSLSFQDVFVVQENHFKFNALCQVLPLGIPYLSSLCHCSSTMQFQHSVWIQKQLPVHDLEEEVDKSRWCVRKARCTSNDMQIGKCHVHVDPIRRSCLILQHDELEVSQHWQQVNTVTAYEEKVPKLVNVLPTGWKKKFYHPYHKQAKQFVVDALSYIPYYLFNLCMGMFIMYYASDFAEDAVFHFFLEAFIGVFFALFILAFLGKKSLNYMLGSVSHASYGLIPIPALFTVIYLVVTNPSAAAYVRDQLYEFWDNGAFGLPWLGKAYFVVCISLSLSVSKYFRLFHEDSSLAPLMIYSVKMIGILFLCNSSSSREIALGVVLIGLCAEYFRDWFNYAYLILNAKSPRYVMNQRKMNEEEFEAFQSVNTKKHLDALRSHLMENKRDLYQHYDQLTVNGKPHEAELLKRFVTGSYEGKPSRPSLPPKKKSVWLTYVLYFVSIPVLVGLCAAAYLQLKSQEVDLSQLFFTIMTSIRAKFNL